MDLEDQIIQAINLSPQSGSYEVSQITCITMLGLYDDSETCMHPKERA